MTEIHNDKLCKNCRHHTIIHNRDYDGKTKCYCKRRMVGTDNCKEFKRFGES